MRLQGLIFDLDGTVADTLPVALGAFRTTLRGYTGRAFSDAEIRATFGPSEEGIFQRLVPDRWQDALRDYLHEYERIHAETCPGPFPGLREMLASLRGGKLRIAMVTGKATDSTALSLAALGLEGAFEEVLTGSAAGIVKAIGIRELLGRWDLPAERVAYVGDAPADMAAAHDAGVVPLAAAWAPGTDVDGLRAGKPAALFRTVSELADWLAGSRGGVGDPGSS